jgi:NADPH-dependent curcumin reductase CurA
MKNNQKIIIHTVGASFRECTAIVEEAKPDPKPGQILVRQHFAGVNGVYDQMMCLDRVDHTCVVPPADTGVEAVGMVEALGEGVSQHRVGDPVAVVNVGGGYRLWQVCDEGDAIAVPAASPEILALIPSGVSALLALDKTAEMGTGQTVCITAAAGGLGNVMTQLAVHAGNHVIAVCGGARKVAVLKELGAHRVVNYKEESLVDVLASDYKDKLDIAMDSVGGELFDALVDNLAPFGRLVICGFTSDRVPTAKVEQERIYTKLYWKAASVRGYMNYRFARFAPAAREHLLQLYSSGAIRPLVDSRTFKGLDSVADAVEYLLAGDNVGKLVVDLR